MTDPGRQIYRVAVVVFAEVEGCDEGDAESALEIAVRHSLRGPLGDTMPQRITALTHGKQLVEAEVRAVVGLGRATGDTYLAVEPTSKPFR